MAWKGIVWVFVLAGLFLTGCSPQEGTPVNLERKSMNVEYDYQWGAVSCDLFQQGRDGLMAEFDGANMDVIIYDDETSLELRKLGSYTALIVYITEHYGYWHTMYLLGVDDQDPRDSRLRGAAGITIPPRDTVWEVARGPFAHSVVFTGYIWEYFRGADYRWNDNTILDCIDRVVIHELGHQRANLSDQEKIGQNRGRR